tara:strand:- start:919 stop:2232 length:1314 start_codon:yes stop_codon:yes gene_type:complete
MILEKTPTGRNGLATDLLFKERLYYRENAFPKYGPRPIDMWYEKPYYGKVDIYGNPVYPTEYYLKQIPGTNLHALGPVVDAFSDFKQFLLHGAAADKTQVFDFIGNLKPVGAWESIHTLYHDYFTNVVYDTYVNSYIDAKKRVKVKNFNDFVMLFMDFCSFARTEMPFTKTAFITSGLCPNSISGLTISLTNESSADDRKKYTRFLSNPNFDDYKRAAAGFGFYIDKNSPWRMVANFASNKMKSYMVKDGLSVEDNGIFSEAYIRARKYDYRGLKKYLYQSYRSFIEASPNLIETTSSRCENKKIFEVLKKIEPRELVIDSFEEFSKTYGDEYFLFVYLQIRLIESGKPIRKSQLKRMYDDLLNLNRYIGLDAAINRIDYFTKQTRIYEPPRPNDSTPFQIKYLPPTQLSGLSFVGESDMLLLLGQTQAAYGSFSTY